MKCALHSDPIYREHDTGEGHPETAARVLALEPVLAGIGGLKIPLREATDKELSAVHDRSYLRLVRQEVASGATNLSTGDTRICPRSEVVARHATGAALAAVDLVCTGKVQTAFCATRPPGHHATASSGMGFCIYNHIAAAARYAQTAHSLSRVAIVDWDVHHGNGTQDIFYADPSVHYFSTHQSPLYPGTGKASETGSGKAAGTTLNVPLPAGSGMAEIGAAFSERWLPAMRDFSPDLILVSAGFDSRIGDPLGAFTLTDENFAELTRVVRSVSPDGKLVSILEGGYAPGGLARAVQAHLGALQ